jgi:hypothetical protein
MGRGAKHENREPIRGYGLQVIEGLQLRAGPRERRDRPQLPLGHVCGFAELLDLLLNGRSEAQLEARFASSTRCHGCTAQLLYL